jgi:hypothetical protein
VPSLPPTPRLPLPALPSPSIPGLPLGTGGLPG